ncbi:transmembrane protease serine 9 isoform X1 [Anastrepha ludens]|uniref:transmembrane protease serine 9 isoform X1 n=2 Tax=Anastrepha ludens TaxID=28586 RepID=UPI0023AF098E|nr:transmembrane protease serine 9 isoform X1 [Anastrepha ludens]
MRRHSKTFLLFCSLWHAILCAELNTTVAQVKLLPADIQDLQTRSNASAAQLLPLAENDGEDTETVEAHQEAAALEVYSSEEPSRYRRQLFYDPSLLMLTNFGAEGSKCITSRGYAGICVRFTACQQFYRFKRQLNFLALRQWPQTPGVGQDICSFYDPFGRPNTGICCTGTFMGNGLGGAGMFPPFIYPGGVNPLPTPPTIPTRPSNEPEEDELEEEKDEEDIIELDHPTEIDPLVDPLHVPTAGGRPEFQAENNVVYDPIKEDEDSKPQTTTGTPVSTYNEFAYQWPSQFGNQFTGAHQWPPPLPTHPPSAAVWPPPLPTHPPNHHYPTHASVTTRPTAHTTTRRTTTKRPVAVTTPRPTTTTTRRPSYPSYPGYPGYPNYPTYRPTAAPTTTHRPTYPATPISSGSSNHGLPAQCGIKNPATPDQERIVGGTNASPHEFPWIAVLFKSGKQFCGGSVITKNHILTAAHCVARMTSWDVAALTAHLGDYDIRTNYEVQHVVRRIKRLVRHKGFDFSTLHNDIAILTVNEPMKFTYEVQPICLPTGSSQLSRSYSGKVATVAGWGSLRENGPQPSILQKVQIPIWANQDCARKYGRAAPGGIIESMVCAGQASKDSCSGDSGGPLIVNESGRYTLVGIVSWGIGCGKGEYPGVYTRITSLLPWIYKNIK